MLINSYFSCILKLLLDGYYCKNVGIININIK